MEKAIEKEHVKAQRVEGSKEQAVIPLTSGRSCEHGDPQPCPVCEEKHRKLREWQQEQEDFLRAKEEAERNEHITHPEKILEYIGVGKRHLCCSLGSYQGGDKVKDICRQFLENPFDLVISGGTGSGKTHLAVAILRELVKTGKLLSSMLEFCGGRHGKFVSVPDLLAEIRASYRGGDLDEQKLVEKYSSLHYLVLDDLGAEKSTEWSISTLYLIIDRRHRAMLPTVATTNLTMDEIGEQISRRIASRLSSGKVVEIKAPDYRMKRGA